MADRRAARRPASRPRVDPARQAALEVLTAVRVEDAYANLVLPAVLRSRGLVGRDAGLVTELVAGTLRGRGTYDAVLAACIDRPLRKVQVKVLDVLRLGAHQLLAMRVPTHAAISTSVDLAKAAAGQGAGGFVNAVLRKVAADDLAGWTGRLAAAAPDDDARLALAHSHPAWVVAELRRAVGDDELPALLAADNAPPRVTLVARPGRATPDELPGTPTRWSPHGVTLDGGDPTSVPAVAEGRAGVQDEGSQLVALLAAAVPVVGDDAVWVDLCAGPGGKSALLAALAAGRDARLLAVERQPHRARLVARNLGLRPGAPLPDGVAGVVTADGTRPPLRPGSVDRVLVDAPCTGLGALRRRPEARWRRRPEDVTELVPLQRALLASALDLARPGGVVLYATCSPVLAETAEVVSAVLDARPDAALVDLRPTAAAFGLDDAVGALPGSVQLWPHRHGTDAMFVAALHRS
ncbi:rRNA cytosine-C5-methyltransferase [Nocardioides sp. TRM66260-LWL]|uniref:RsmB/NOP family class I SAM-dependent RNA methyltransferase n=1 Tax=Nocardioides sp. TRM66260-LWL TaxID=2874478 RepID=UPI001CC7DD5E|nr:transcription antitermination factor NusB [Nocardioides sp. TRM66260-LWL]MBZ5733860.1 rRNA cytosine-C5-methyltransferase [Nocardioides sp. TRM66260-LWL]